MSRIAAFVSILLYAAAAAFAQINTATVVGTVADPSGAVVAGAAIVITNGATGAVRKTVSNDAGAYEIPLLNVGTYSIVAEQKGFKRAEQTEIHLDAGQKAKIDLTLQVGDVAESVTVTAAASLLNTQTVERGQVIGSNQVSNLPLNGRDIVQLISLQPGVVVGGQIKSTVTFNGLPYQGTTINIDGTDAANPDRPTAGNFSGQTRLNLISQEFIEEFKTTQGVFSAEIGRAAGGSVNVITKSGTNQFHGDLFEFVRNDKFDARNFFAARKDELRLNQFGGTVGGPIIRDRLFFFGGWEASRERRGSQITGHRAHAVVARQNGGRESGLRTAGQHPAAAHRADRRRHQSRHPSPQRRADAIGKTSSPGGSIGNPAATITSSPATRFSTPR